MSRPPKTDTVQFRRTLSEADRTILLCAGKGNISLGFKNILDCYAILWELGYRPRADLRDFLGVDEESQQNG
jgi:hypothetical protein